MGQVLLLLGGNVGDVAGTLARARELLASRLGPLKAVGRVHRTAPWGLAGQPHFLNQAVLVATVLTPQEVLATCLAIETDLGRDRTVGPRYGPRPIDIDLLLMGDLVLSGPALTLPHPHLQERRFALAPAADVAPDARHPLLGRSVLDLLIDLDRPHTV